MGNLLSYAADNRETPYVINVIDYQQGMVNP